MRCQQPIKPEKLPTGPGSLWKLRQAPLLLPSPGKEAGSPSRASVDRLPWPGCSGRGSLGLGAPTAPEPPAESTLPNAGKENSAQPPAPGAHLDVSVYPRPRALTCTAVFTLALIAPRPLGFTWPLACPHRCVPSPAPPNPEICHLQPQERRAAASWPQWEQMAQSSGKSTIIGINSGDLQIWMRVFMKTKASTARRACQHSLSGSFAPYFSSDFRVSKRDE